MMAVCTFLAEVGGIPCLFTNLRILASACLARLVHRRRFSTKASAESSHTPNHLVAPSAKKICWSPTWIGLRFFFFLNLFRLVNSMASVLLVSNRTAFSSAQPTTGPGQAFSRAITEIAERLEARSCSTTLRWTPARRGVGGNEVADEYANVAAESTGD